MDVADNTFITFCKGIASWGTYNFVSDIYHKKIHKKTAAFALAMAVMGHKFASDQKVPKNVLAWGSVGVFFAVYNYLSMVQDEVLPAIIVDDPDNLKRTQLLLFLGANPNAYEYFRRESRRRSKSSSWRTVEDSSTVTTNHHSLVNTIYYNVFRVIKGWRLDSFTIKYPLTDACRDNNVELAKLLMNYKANVNCQEHEGARHTTNFPLEIVTRNIQSHEWTSGQAVLNNQLAIAKLLIDNRANVTHKNRALEIVTRKIASEWSEWATIYYDQRLNNQLPIAKLLIDNRANVTHENQALVPLLKRNSVLADQMINVLLKGCDAGSLKILCDQNNLDFNVLNSRLLKENPQAKLEVIVPLQVNMRAVQPGLFDKQLCQEVVSYL